MHDVEGAGDNEEHEADDQRDDHDLEDRPPEGIDDQRADDSKLTQAALAKALAEDGKLSPAAELIEDVGLLVRMPNPLGQGYCGSVLVRGRSPRSVTVRWPRSG